MELSVSNYLWLLYADLPLTSFLFHSLSKNSVIKIRPRMPQSALEDLHRPGLTNHETPSDICDVTQGIGLNITVVSCQARCIT